ncbi:MAG: hypothetical protein JSV80_07450, partial [Acidobacteriota bacterium]
MRLSPEVLASRSSRLTFCLSLVILLIPTCSQAGTDPPEKLRGELASLLDRAPATELIPVSIVMSEQLDRETIERLSDQEHGREKIVARLKSLARTS